MNHFAIGNCLFGAFFLTKNADSDKYGYSGYGIGFDVHSSFSLRNGSGFSKNVTIFDAGNRSVVHDPHLLPPSERLNMLSHLDFKNTSKPCRVFFFKTVSTNSDDIIIFFSSLFKLWIDNYYQRQFSLQRFS